MSGRRGPVVFRVIKIDVGSRKHFLVELNNSKKKIAE